MEVVEKRGSLKKWSSENALDDPSRIKVLQIEKGNLNEEVRHYRIDLGTRPCS
jgi:hypothetical protein